MAAAVIYTKVPMATAVIYTGSYNNSCSSFGSSYIIALLNIHIHKNKNNDPDTEKRARGERSNIYSIFPQQQLRKLECITFFWSSYIDHCLVNNY